MDDKSILKLFEERSEEALDAVSQSYRGLCFDIAFRILRSAEDAEECVNDVLLALWNSIPPLPGNLRAYISKLARNAAIDVYRNRNADKRGGGQVSLIIDELSECIPDRRASGDMCSDMVLKDLLKRFVASLGDESRRMFVMRYWYSYSCEEVAKTMSVSPGKVKSRLARARKKLKKQLEKEDVIV